jgi:hypothetical protein
MKTIAGQKRVGAEPAAVAGPTPAKPTKKRSAKASPTTKSQARAKSNKPNKSKK